MNASALIAVADFALATPWADIIAAAKDPSNLSKDAEALEDVIGALPIPPLEGLAAELAIAGFLALIQASGGGTIRPEPLPMTDGQTTQTRAGRRG
jgi:hypothetical protein